MLIIGNFWIIYYQLKLINSDFRNSFLSIRAEWWLIFSEYPRIPDVSIAILPRAEFCVLLRYFTPNWALIELEIFTNNNELKLSQVEV